MIRMLLLLGLQALSSGTLHATSTAYQQLNFDADYFSHWQPNNALDMLLHLPGISLQQDAGGQLLLQLHGMGNRYLAILVDGHPLTGDSINNARSARQIPASLIQRIELSRSGRADLDSRGGAAGTINLILVSDEHSQNQLRLYTSGAPLNSAAAANGSVVNNQHRWQYAFDGQKIRNTVSAEELISTASSQTKDSWRNSIREDSSSYYLGYQYQQPDTLISSSLLYLKNQQILSNSGRSNNANSNNLLTRNNDQDSLRFSSEYHTDWSHMRWKTKLVVESYQKQDQLQRSRAQYDDQRWLLRSSLEEVVDEHHWQSGINVRQMQRSLTSNQRTPNNINNSLIRDFDVTENSLHLFGLDRWHLTDTTRFEAGFRMETYQLKQTDKLSTGASETTGDTYWLPSIHLKHQYSDRLELQFSGFQSVRQPELASRIPFRIRQDKVELRGNGNLQAELVSSNELSIRYQPTQSDDYFRFYLFQRTINDAILEISRQQQVDNTLLTIIEPQNSEVSGTLRGAELDGQWQLTAALRLNLNAGLYRSFMRATGERQSQPLAHQPSYTIQAALHGVHAQWRYGFHWRYQGGSKERLNNLSQTSIDVDSRVGQQLEFYLNRQWQRWCASLGVLQVLDDDSVITTGNSQLRYHREARWQAQVKWDF